MQKFHYEKKYLLENIKNEIRPDINILWLPVAHCEFNQIELIWEYVKNTVARENRTFNNAQAVLQLCKQIMDNLPPDLWKKCTEHAKTFENYYTRVTRLAELQEPIIINTAEDSDSSSETSLSDTEEICSDDGEILSDSDGALSWIA